MAASWERARLPSTPKNPKKTCVQWHTKYHTIPERSWQCLRQHLSQLANKTILNPPRPPSLPPFARRDPPPLFCFSFLFVRRGERLQLRSPHQTRLRQAGALGFGGLLRRDRVLPNMRVRGNDHAADTCTRWLRLGFSWIRCSAECSASGGCGLELLRFLSDFFFFFFDFSCRRCWWFCHAGCLIAHTGGFLSSAALDSELFRLESAAWVTSSPTVRWYFVCIYIHFIFRAFM